MCADPKMSLSCSVSTFVQNSKRTIERGVRDICCGKENIVVAINSEQADLDHLDFQYTPDNVPSSRTCGMDPREIQYSGCSCSLPTCEHSSCECINRFGPNYTSSGQLLRNDGEERSIKWDVKNGDCEMYRISMPIFECNASCLCGERCENRLVQNGIRHKMEVFRTKSKGWGLRTLETIPKDSFVCEYAGEVLTTEEARKRVGAMQAGDMNFVFVLNETFGGGQASRTCIDARYKGNIARFINHSCEPNLCLVAVRIHNEIPHVAMFALREISPGQELTYHYCGRSENPQSSQEMAANEGGLSWTPCMCESPSCKKFLPRDVSI